MRIGVSISLLCVLLFQTMLLSPWMQLSLKLHKKEVKERIQDEEEELMQLRFMADAFLDKVVRKGEEEFLYRGMMYDVVDAERVGDEILLTVYEDEEETRMKKEHEAVRKRQKKEGEKNGDPPGKVHPFKYYWQESRKEQHLFRYSTLLPKQPLSLLPKTHQEVPVPPPC